MTAFIQPSQKIQISAEQLYKLYDYMFPYDLLSFCRAAISEDDLCFREYGLLFPGNRVCSRNIPEGISGILEGTIPVAGGGGVLKEDAKTILGQNKQF